VRDGRYGAYVNWGKVNATISKSTAPDSVTLSDALELIAEREGKPVARPRKAAKSAPTKGKTQPVKAGAKESAGARAKPRSATAAAPRRPPANKPQAVPKKPAAKKR
jgi:DNA topoisomerase I